VTGEALTFSFSGLVVASVLYSRPFTVQPLESAFEGVGRGSIEAAASLGASPLDAFLHVIGTRLIHVHVHDNRGVHDDHLPPGSGTIQWAKVFEGLRRADYEGHLMLELACRENLTDHFTQALAATRDLMG